MLGFSGNARCTVGLDDFKGLFQPKLFYKIHLFKSSHAQKDHWSSYFSAYTSHKRIMMDEWAKKPLKRRGLD